MKSMYGVIERSVAVGASTSQIWEAIRNAAGEDRPSFGRNAAAQVSTLRGYAASVRNASQRLASLGDNEAIGGEHLGEQPWSRPANLRSAAPKFAARVEMLVQNTAFLEGVPGEPEHVSQWTTVHFDSLPATAGQAREQALTGATEAGDRYNRQVVGVGRIDLLTL